MNNLCADIGWRSINHEGEQLCGDHVDIIEQNESSLVIVLADGLGSGVKASILSTLTSKIISTMLAEGLKLEECVSTIAATLPICSVRGVAYSTFTIIHLIDNETAELMQYDNPQIILLRDGEITDYPYSELNIEGKRILRSTAANSAEWYFLMGSIAYKRGWMDDARQNFWTASSMEPNNIEYRQAVNQMNLQAQRGSYQGGDDLANLCTTLCCLNCLCNSCN